MIRKLCRWRVAVCILLILLFGLPVFMLPDKVEGEGRATEWYNKTLGSSTYKEKIKPIVDKALGGSLRLFIQKVYNGSYLTRNEEVVLYVYANLPNGSTLEQMNELIKKMEIYLSQFKEIKQFQTSVYNARRGNINIYFAKASKNGFPYTTLKPTLSVRPCNWVEVAGVYTACRIKGSVMMFVREPVRFR